MAKYDSNSLRNIAIAGHGGTGKTSLCESFLFFKRKNLTNLGGSTMEPLPWILNRKSKKTYFHSFGNKLFEWKNIR